MGTALLEHERLELEEWWRKSSSITNPVKILST